MFIIGVDVGGTFTDSVVIDEDGALFAGKALSTPADFGIGALNSVKDAATSLNLPIGDLLQKSAIFSIGTTIAENAIVNRSGAKVALLTTAGFEDTILIMRASGRITGLSDYDISHITATSKPIPLVPRHLIKGITERVDKNGKIIVAMDLSSVKRALDDLPSQRVESIAVSLLWSFKNGIHEQRIKEMIRQEMRSSYSTISSELAPIIGEFERTSTTVLNAYIGPVVSRSISSLISKLQKSGFAGHLFLMYSHGGVLPARREIINAVGLIEGGPVAGVLASLHLGGLTDCRNIIASDMGGTTFKVGVIYDAKLEKAREPSIAQYRMTIPRLDVVSIGAGGGSIAWVEPITGLLKVGPQSAGADPGPICYGLGGTEPTVTDADLLLGYLDPDYFLGGRIPLHRTLAIQGLKKRIGSPMGLDIMEAAYAIREIVDAQMTDLVRKATVERGYDPREFVLYAYGGAGPVHADSIGPELGVESIVVPSTASVHCALGVATSNVVHEYALSDPMRVPADSKKVETNLKQLQAKASRDLLSEGFRDKDIMMSYYLDFRYRRQVHEITTPFTFHGTISVKELEMAYDEFESLYERQYGKGSAYKEAGIEIVTFRLTAVGKMRKPAIAKNEVESKRATHAVKGKRRVCFGVDEIIETKVYQYERMRPGNTITGPAIIETPVTSIALRSDHEAEMDCYRNIRISW